VTRLPKIGLGTWDYRNREECLESVRTSLEIGYRHIDTAQIYETEGCVGEAVMASDVPREEVIIATKVHEYDPGLGYEEFYKAAENRLDKLGMKYIDLLYIHRPIGNYDPGKTLAELDRVVEDGIANHVGLSNFTPELLDEARSKLNHPIFAHQIEMHPFLQQEELHNYALQHDHTIVAYTPFAGGEIFDNDVLGDIADKYDADEAQVTLAWLCSKRNVVAIPKSTSYSHLCQNWESQNMSLKAEDIDQIDSIHEVKRQGRKEGAHWVD